MLDAGCWMLDGRGRMLDAGRLDKPERTRTIEDKRQSYYVPGRRDLDLDLDLDLDRQTDRLRLRQIKAEFLSF